MPKNNKKHSKRTRRGPGRTLAPDTIDVYCGFTQSNTTSSSGNNDAYYGIPATNLARFADFYLLYAYWQPISCDISFYCSSTTQQTYIGLVQLLNPLVESSFTAVSTNGAVLLNDKRAFVGNTYKPLKRSIRYSDTIKNSTSIADSFNVATINVANPFNTTAIAAQVVARFYFRFSRRLPI